MISFLFRLKQHNRLSSGLIFPGQILKIPPQEPDKPPELKKDNNEVPGRKTSAPIPEEPEIFDSQFVKVNVRFITEGKGIVSGSLFLTPKNVSIMNDAPFYSTNTTIKSFFICISRILLNRGLLISAYVYSLAIRSSCGRVQSK